MPWFHVNGIPVLAASKAAAVTAWREGRLIPIHDKLLAAELQEVIWQRNDTTMSALSSHTSKVS